MIGGRGYHAYDERRTGLYLLNNILGGPGMNSRLNVSLRERRGLVYTCRIKSYLLYRHRNVLYLLRLRSGRRRLMYQSGAERVETTA